MLKQATMKGLVLASTALAMLNGVQVSAEVSDNVRIVKSKIPYVFDDQAPGPYNAVFDAILNQVDAVSVEHFWMPHALSTRQLVLGTADCRFLTGSNYDYFRDWGFAAENVLFSDVVNSLKLKVYSSPGTSASHRTGDAALG